MSSSGITGRGGRVLIFFTRKFSLTYREKKGKEEMKDGEEKKENLNGKMGKIKIGREKVWKWAEEQLFACHFLKPLKFVWGLGLPKWTTGEKAYFTPAKNQERWICPLGKIFLFRHWCLVCVVQPVMIYVWILLRVYCAPNQKSAYFVLYPKVIDTFLKINTYIVNCPRNSKMALKF